MAIFSLKPHRRPSRLTPLLCLIACAFLVSFAPTVNAQNASADAMRLAFEQARQLVEHPQSTHDIARGMKQLHHLAETENPLAQDWLGQAYESGQPGLAVNLQEAERYFQLAANNGYTPAQMRLGRFYLFGIGVNKDIEEGIFWLKKAALSGNAQSALLLAQYYEFNQKERPENLTEAAFWLHLVQGPLTPMAQQSFDRLSKRFTTTQKLELEQRLNAIHKQSTTVALDASSNKNDSQSKRVPSTAQVIQASRSGTGFWVSAEAYAITSLHVVENCAQIEAIDGNGKTHSLKLKAGDKEHDLALLKGPQLLASFATFGTDLLAVGDEVATLGHPYGGIISDQGIFTNGIVNSLLDNTKGKTAYFQFSAAIQPGNSGGPIVNISGQVVGMASAILSNENAWIDARTLPQNVNFAISSQDLRQFLTRHQVKLSTSNMRARFHLTELYKRLQPITIRLRCLN